MSDALPERSCTRSWWGWPGQVTWTGQRDIPWHRMSWAVYKQGKLDMRAWSLLEMGWVSAGGEPVYWASLAFLGVFPLSFSLSLLYFKVFKILNYSYLNPQVLQFFFFWFPSPFCHGEAGGEGRGWVSGCMELNCGPELNYDNVNRQM